MTIKNHTLTPHGGWSFYVVLKGTETILREPSLSQLIQSVSRTLQLNGEEVPENLAKIVEHQICLRQPRPAEDCWSGGIGDDIHHKFMKPMIESLQKVALAATGRRSKTLDKVKDCRKCGGATVYVPGVDPFGRAEVINQFAK